MSSLAQLKPGSLLCAAFPMASTPALFYWFFLCLFFWFSLADSSFGVLPGPSSSAADVSPMIGTGVTGAWFAYCYFSVTCLSTLFLPCGLLPVWPILQHG